VKILNKLRYADDDVTPLGRLLLMRAPSLFLGLFLGLFLSFITSEFEEVLARNVQIAFFIPFVVYMADAVGTQTQSIYTRDLVTGKASFKRYLVKETFIGLIFGLLFSVIAGGAVYLWLRSGQVSMAVFLGMFGAVASAPVISMVVAEILELEHSDPAVGAGPIATVIQDTSSVLIYGLVCSAVFL